MKNILKKSPLMIALILAIISGLIFTAGKGRRDLTIYLAQNGGLNLENWNWSEKPVVELNGEWEFYPNDFKERLYLEEDPLMKTVPHFWECDPDLDFSPYGCGTYRLRITRAPFL